MKDAKLRRIDAGGRPSDLTLVIQEVKIGRKKRVRDDIAAGYRHGQIYSFYLNPEYPVVVREFYMGCLFIYTKTGRSAATHRGIYCS